MIKFFKCSNNGLVIPITHVFTNEDSLQDVKEITPNSVDAAAEKHMPVVTINGNTVTVNVGSVTHPMTEEHLITTVVLETQNGAQYRYLAHDNDPIVHFSLHSSDKPVAAYAYCNLHGLWKVDIES
ncbi:desulfoferrodoxin family protein [[Clostridium] polysaccharolyticum]|uniref:Superoxide reductase n=1 Tax=[Clostridium] polysaccharolyticum TaxID=29364 RepID=A0A1I0EYM5_9FIRM|nr:desulfoferrodoxin family protein [[Clostridium] polysaccharolyticum]SET50759.1 superoxide reductase [[Clostridium] polysaccharolyticum]